MNRSPKLDGYLRDGLAGWEKKMAVCFEEDGRRWRIHVSTLRLTLLYSGRNTTSCQPGRASPGQDIGCPPLHDTGWDEETLRVSTRRKRGVTSRSVVNIVFNPASPTGNHDIQYKRLVDTQPRLESFADSSKKQPLQFSFTHTKIETRHT